MTKIDVLTVEEVAKYLRIPLAQTGLQDAGIGL